MCTLCRHCQNTGWVSIFFLLGGMAKNGILLSKLFWPDARKNCSSDRGWRARIWKSYLNSERSEQFSVTEYFLTCSWRFLRSNKLEQLELEKIIGIEKHAGKVKEMFRSTLWFRFSKQNSNFQDVYIVF